MDVLVFALALLGLTAFVAAPLYARTQRFADDDSAPRKARHDALVAALRDLEVDRASGLVSAEDYQRERAALEAEAATTIDQNRHD